MKKHNANIIFEETGRPEAAYALWVIFWVALAFAVVVAALEMIGITDWVHF